MDVPFPSTAERSPTDQPQLDRDSFVELLRSHDERMRGLAYKLLGGDRDRMDDALQDAYLRAYAALPRFRREADVGTWLYRIVYNACVDELRRGGRRPEPVDLTTPAWDRPTPRPGPDAVVGAADATVRALAALSVDQRVTVVLVDGEGFDNVAAARILGVAPGTVASRLSRARAALRRAFEREEVEPAADETTTEGGTTEEGTTEEGTTEEGTTAESTAEESTAEAEASIDDEETQR